VQESCFGSAHDIHYMRTALKQASVAARKGEVPVGALVVNRDGVILARAHNVVEKRQTQCAHAEIIALERAARKHGGWRLGGCWLFVTLEPCTMCFGMAQLSRVEGVVYGASSPLYGYSLDTKIASPLYSGGAFQVIGGICAEESAELLGRFFKKRRENGE